ncbi:MAG: RHS repeat-associated core domain-containing protein [Bacteroidales bacterium]
MRTIKKYLIAAVLLNAGIIYSQQSCPNNPSCSLNTLFNDATYVREARDAVYLEPGFSYKPTGTNNLAVRTNENIVCPTNYIQNPFTSGTRPFNTNLPVGATAGNFGVNSGGTANYSIPIAVPPGINGMQPNISINYSSNSGTGIMGLKWGLSCLSAINVVGKNLYNNNKIEGVDCNSPSNYEIDGMRLVNAGGTVFRKELEDFSKIEAMSTQGHGYQYFKVTTKDGMVLEYGNSADSRVLFQGCSNTVMTWLLTRVIDKFSNSVEYYYHNNSASPGSNPVEWWLERIEYTKNTNKNLAPVNKIYFFYEATANIDISYIAGGSFASNNVILKKIRTESQGVVVHKYEFNYTDKSSFDGSQLTYSRLNEVVEYGSDDSKLNSTIIEWGIDNEAYDYEVPYNGPPRSEAAVERYSAIIDYNNDGFPDIVTYNSNDENNTMQVLSSEFSSNNGSTYKRAFNSVFSDGIGQNSFVYARERNCFLWPKGEAHIMSSIGSGVPDKFMRWESSYKGFFNTNNGSGISEREINEKTLDRVYGPRFPICSTPISSRASYDLNGDGKSDIVELNKTVVSEYGPNQGKPIRFFVRVFLNDNGSGFQKLNPGNGYVAFDRDYPSVDKHQTFMQYGYHGDEHAVFHYSISDYDGDGISNDLIIIAEEGCNGTNGHHIKLSWFQFNKNTNMFDNKLEHVDLPIGIISPSGIRNTLIQRVSPIDFDGNGITELFISSGGISSGSSGSDPDYSYLTYNYICKIINGQVQLTSIGDYGPKINEYIIPSDYNNDGKTDFIVSTVDASDYSKTVNHSFRVYYSTGNLSSAFLENTTNIPIPQNLLLQNYFHNDGSSRDKPHGDNEGDYFDYSYYLDLGYNIRHFVTPTDVDGDGRTDLIYFADDGTSDQNFTLTAYLFKGFDNSGNPIYVPKSFGLISGYSSEIAQYEAITADFNGDGIADLFIPDKINSALHRPFYFNSRKLTNGSDIILVRNENFVNKITNGFNSSIEISYKPVTYQNPVDVTNNDNVYTETSAPITSPNIIKCAFPFYVVDKVLSNSGIKDGQDNWIKNTTKYCYEDGRIHINGGGFLGFSKVITKTPSLISNDYYSFKESGQITDANHYILTYLSKNEITKPNNSLVSRKEYSYLFKNFDKTRVTTYNSYTKTTDFLTSTYSENFLTWDQDNGNLLNSTAKKYNSLSATNPDWQAQEINTYISAGSWLPNKPETTISKSTKTGTSWYSRETDYVWNATTGVQEQIIQDPGKPKSITTSYSYDADYGLLQNVKIIASDIDTRETQLLYDATKRFVTKTTKISTSTPVNIVNEAQYDSKTGNVIWSKDENGLITSFKYDGFGRLSETTMPNNTKAAQTYSWNLDGNIMYYVESTADKTAPARQYYDIAGRVVKSETKGFNDVLVTTTQKYNEKGQLVETNSPKANTTGTITISYTWDDIGRPQQVVSPLKNVSYTYNLLTYTQTDMSVTPNRSKITVMDAAGNVIKAKDEKGELYYTYNDMGKVISITSNIGVVTTLEYDPDYGFQKKLIEQNYGTTQYDYFSTGELKTQTTPKEIYNLTYDKLGRLLTKTGTDGAYTYVYDNEPNGIGKIGYVTCPGASPIKVSYKYDALSRNNQVKEEIPAKSKTFITNTVYDNYGRIDNVTYPSVVDPQGYKVNYLYDNYSNLKEVKDAQNNQTLWKLNSVNNILQPLSQQLGANNTLEKTYTDYGFLSSEKYLKSSTILKQTGYDFDIATGNLNWRKDILRNFTESFTYDNIDRLKEVYKNSIKTLDMTYADNGNILNKSDAGNYVYDPTKINAVTKIDNCPISQILQNVTYTKFDKLNDITEGQYYSKINYGPDINRSYMEVSQNSLLQYTRYYFGNYEMEDRGGQIKEYYYLTGGAVCIKQGTTNTFHYIMSDHLGSVTGYLDQNGNKEAEYSYDAWGRMRNPNDWSYTSVPTLSITPHGFTMHEHLSEFNLINMNGRVYDPLVGRFLSPDILVQDATGSQCYNRYSYCVNNPLKFTDPSGYKFDWQWFIDQNLSSAELQAKSDSYSRNIDGSYSNEKECYDRQREALNVIMMEYQKSIDRFYLLGGGSYSGNQRGMWVDCSYISNDGAMTYESNTGIGGSIPGSSVISCKFIPFIDFSNVKSEEKSGGGGQKGGQNTFGDTYTGSNNPVGYSLPPLNHRDAISMAHDKGYDAFGAKGPKSVFINGYVLPVDYRFVADQYKLGLRQIFNGLTAQMGTGGYDLQQGFYSIMAGTAIGVPALFKTTFINPYKIP